MLNRYVRGQVWAIRTEIVNGDRVFNGEHMALILGVNKENTITVIPSTSKFNAETKILTNVELELTNLDGVKTVGHFIPNMIQTIDTKKAYRYVGMLDEDSVIKVQEAVGRYLGFDKIQYPPVKVVLDTSERETKIEAEEQQKIKDWVNENLGIPNVPQAITNRAINTPKTANVGDTGICGGKIFTKEVDGLEMYGRPIDNWPKKVLNDITAMYKAGDPILGIAYKYGVSDSSIGRWVHRNNIKRGGNK